VPTDRLSHIWAKSARRGEERGESLVEHTVAVLSTLGRLRLLNPDLADAVGQPDVWSWIYWACALHDLGKCASGFQRQLKEAYRWENRHEVLSLAFLPLIVNADHRLAFSAVAAGVVAHHKDAGTIQELYPIGTDLREQRVREMIGEVAESDVELIADWLLELKRSGPALGATPAAEPKAFARTFHESAVEAIFSALEEYQWLVGELHKGRAHPLLLAGLALRGLVTSADHIGSAHQEGRIWPPFRNTPPEKLRPPGELWSHQRAAMQTAGSTMIIAPTGSGKTETALLWAQRQDALRKVARLFYVLPYQASMNAMQKRLQPALGEVALLHGRALQATYRQLLDEDYARETAEQKARAAQNLASLQVHGTRVLSPYQLLKVVFRLRGYESMSADFFSSVFVYDEIHAYEAKRLALIIAQMGDLVRRFGARVCVMSATLPGFLQDWLRAEVPDLREPIRSSDAEFRKFTRHRLAMRAGDLLDHVDAIAGRARQGSVLVCCNTVNRAQQAYDALRGCGIEPVLLHSRFAGRDRLRKEHTLEPGKEQRLVMVATQVVEVSLNVSFATIFTDPAPLEALLQRFGRVNRFRNLTELAPVHVFSEPTDIRVYSRSLVKRAVELLEARDGQPLDESSVGRWLDEQYTPDILQLMQQEYMPVLNLSKEKLKWLVPFQSDPSLREEFFDMFDAVEVLPRPLEDEYRGLTDEGATIEADSLLVPIQWRQYKRLLADGKVQPKDGDLPPVVDVPYDGEYGLRL
jgi:CRISPR-associated endonuclease/helicase Cas3